MSADSKQPETREETIAEGSQTTFASKKFFSNEPPPEEKKKKKGILFRFLIALVVANGILALLLIKQHHKTDTVMVQQQNIIAERNNIMTNLEKLRTEYSTLITKDVTLQKELDARRADIEKMIVQSKELQNDSYSVIAKLNKETETLHKRKKQYVVEIDSLNTLNQTTTGQKNKVTQDLNAQINKNNELQKDKDSLSKTVNKASVLKAQSPKATGIKLKGGTKEVNVSKASRVEKIKVSFTLGENLIAKSGTKSIYIHIMAPNGKDVTISESEENAIQYDGTRTFSKGFYAEKKDIEYTNTELPVTILCGNPTPFVAGTYLVDIICEGTVIGQTEVTFK